MDLKTFQAVYVRHGSSALEPVTVYAHTHQEAKKIIDTLAQQQGWQEWTYGFAMPADLIADKDAVPLGQTPDPINNPPHYTTGGIETIDFIEAKKLNFARGNVVKYVARAEHKGRELEDLKKAAWYLNREIKKLEAEGGV